MAKGALAKDNLIKRFQTAVGADYVGTDDGKKFYFWSVENGERVQVAVTMTVPKTPLVVEGKGGNLDFEDASVAPTPKTEMGEDEKATLDRLMKELGL